MRRTSLLAALLVLATAGPASAAESRLVLSEVRVDAGLRSVTATLSAEDLPPEVGLDPRSVVVSAGGRALPTTAVVERTETTTSSPRVLLVVDTSGSMQGRPMDEARQAVSRFVADAPPEVQLGLLRFSSSPELLVKPTTDRTRLLGAVSGLQAQGETSLYDAVLTGLTSLGRSGDRRLVVLSDGGDTRSSGSLEQVLAAAGSSGVTVDAIGFNTDESVSAVLGDLAARGRGKVHQASSAAELSSALASSVREQARVLSLRVLVPEDLRGETSLAVSVTTPLGTMQALSPVTLGTSAAPPAVEAGWWGTRNALLAGVAAIALSLLVASLTLLGSGHRQQRRVHAVLERYTTNPVMPDTGAKKARPVARAAVELADKVVTKRNLQDRLSLRLDRAAIALTPAEWLLLRAGVTFGTMLLLVIAGKGLLVAALLSALLGTAGPATVLRIRGARRQRAFDEKLPDALQMVAGSLSAGYSLAQALDGLVREGTEPMAGEIGRALAESRLGVPIESTLDGVAERMGSKDFKWVVMAIRVQREVGGNLAGVLTTVSGTMRERAMLRRHVKGLSAEGRLSAYILIGLPLFLALYMLVLRPEYIRPLYTTGLGVVMLVAAGLLLSIGSFWMSRMVKVEV